MNKKLILMQKSGIIVMKLAQEFIGMEIGDRIDTIANYSEKFKTARGTVQNAIKYLEDNKAIYLEARGHLGTFIVDIDYKKLMHFTDINSIVGVMPLPYSKLYEGLATGLYKTMLKSGIPFSLAYMRGAKSRIEALKKNRYDFAIVSKLAAQKSIEEGLDINIVIEFGEFTYVNEHALIFYNPFKKDIEDGMKVGIDTTSIDHSILTLRQCEGKNVQLIELPYNQIIAKIISGEIDAAVWNIDEIFERKINIKYYPLFNNNLNKMDTEAVLIMNNNKKELESFLKRVLSKEEVLDYQKRVVRGEITPNY
ncbi:Helix-turn-helix domain-containing protein [Caloramator quimbayensis]|uniref:Helix-turn-helix domain-containing protein n=1 Tax=Caloramator quimbayensis TaxID=1147123 RepID=A0A1T4Y695_9CLOT|nr:GntR family transcriptional regulator YhfZ [Caloramator quimbayensis]SKA97183.1 Helix-turn-helix domain-containing protein [Caloramator quimbayensis]